MDVACFKPFEIAFKTYKDVYMDNNLKMKRYWKSKIDI
jgi:hypothetical protein